MSNTTDFLALIAKHNIVRKDSAEISPVGYLDNPVKDELFYGYDEVGRLFINIPIIVVVDDAYWATIQALGLRKGQANKKSTAFTAFQRYSDSDKTFVISGEPDLMDRNYFMGVKNNDFSNLETLLSGKTMRFHEYVYTTKGERLIDPGRWIDVALNVVSTT